MPSDDKKNGRFKKEMKRQRKRKAAIQKEAETDSRTILKRALSDIKETLANSPTEWDIWYLSQVEDNIKNVLKETGDKLAQSASGQIGTAWQAGQDLIDLPLAAGGIQIHAVVPEIDTKQLAAMRSFLTGKMRSISSELATKINSELGLVLIGAQDSGTARKKVAHLVGKGGKKRATTIVRTELGRVYSVATQKRQEQVQEHLPGLKKQWRRSGKINSRVSHDIADGQIVGVNEPFIIGGVPLMFPRDPSGPAKETINCGCDSLPYMDHWDVRQPDRQPFSEDETLMNNLKRDINAGRITNS